MTFSTKAANGGLDGRRTGDHSLVGYPKSRAFTLIVWTFSRP
jgi:hypothetical protein